MVACDLSYEELVQRYIEAKRNADRFYKEMKELEQEMLNRYNAKFQGGN